ncbi:MAG TPA: hypothetical protein VD968_01055 [Pyrinomonadaceae bacterium]|nr:hypothetical protein [Pyrinomonadaceae bacterium]
MSSSDQEQIRALAERVARRLASQANEAGAAGAAPHAADAGDLSAVRDGLADIRRRLAHIESHIGHEESHGPGARSAGDAARTGSVGAQAHGADDARGQTPATSLWLSGTYVPATEHPSQERFGIDEAVSEMVDFFEREKTCNLEPGGKPCDHCGMCSSRGF